MLCHDHALPHALVARAYHDEAVFQLEAEQLFRGSWQLAGLKRDLAQPGQQVACVVGQTPVVVRNDGGRLRGFINACAHRHCEVAKPGCSTQTRLTCPYHGWEYDEDGRLKKLPDGRSFGKIDTTPLRLTEVAVDTIGEIVLFNTDQKAPRFIDSYGALGPEIAKHFAHHDVVRVWSTDHDVNWKIIVENAVESYHVPLVHPGTFRDFRAPELHDHTLSSNYTRYADLLPWGNDMMSHAVRALSTLLHDNKTPARFTHAHAFPTLMFYFNDLVSSLVALQPLSATRTRHVAVSLLPKKIRSPVLRPLQRLFGRVFATMGARVLSEDMRLWPNIQRGLLHSPHAGLLSCREERVHCFQNFVATQVPQAKEAAAPSLRVMA